MKSYEVAEYEFDYADDERYAALPAAPDPGELRIVHLPGGDTYVARFVRVSDVDFTEPEPAVSWNGGPGVVWEFKTLDGQQLFCDPDEVDPC